MTIAFSMNDHKHQDVGGASSCGVSINNARIAGIDRTIHSGSSGLSKTWDRTILPNKDCLGDAGIHIWTGLQGQFLIAAYQ